MVTREQNASLEEASQNPKVTVMVHPDPEAPMGDLLRSGLDAATGDILVTAVSADTFIARDLAKLLVFLRDADLVVGTRTTRQMIEQGSNMRGLVRLAHVVLAKLLEVLWWRLDSRFTDICCVYRGLWRSTYELIRPQLTSRGVEIFPEMVIEVLRSQRRVVEIPVNYFNRNLINAQVRSRYQNVGTFVRILGLMVRKRLNEMTPETPKSDTRS